jgi:hypothetical protein
MKDERLTFCRRETEVVKLKCSFPRIEDYKNVLLKMFNNMREDKDLLEINNYYCNNNIEIVIDLMSYMEDVHQSKEEVVNHLKEWMVSGIDINPNDVKVEFEKARVYEPYEDEFQYFDENDEFIGNYIVNRW